MPVPDSRSAQIQQMGVHSCVSYSQDLGKWIPHLIKIWRAKYNRPGPTDRLLPPEITSIAQHVLTLSQGLTRERELAGFAYFSEPGWLGAYLLYFWPVSYIQARYILQTLNPKPQRVLELGAGAGPLSAACYDLGVPTVTFADRSPEALTFARQLAQIRNRKSDSFHWNPQKDQAIPHGPYDCISLQHLLNELWVLDPHRLEKIQNLLLSLGGHLTPQGSLLIMEPALTPTSRTLLSVRNYLLTQGWQITSPCLLQTACPALLKETDSCHMDLPWQAPLLVKTLAKSAGFKKKELKMTYLVLVPPDKKRHLSHTADCFLIVSEPMESKNKRIRYVACGPAGRIGLALKPDEANENNRVFLTLRRGDKIRVVNGEKIDQGIKIVASTRIELLQRL